MLSTGEEMGQKSQLVFLEDLVAEFAYPFLRLFAAITLVWIAGNAAS
jgi:hypothetical protein